jgi:hypothetical protein
MPEARVPAPIQERLAEAKRPVRGPATAWRGAYAEDVAALLRLVESLSDRILAAHEVLALRAERKECRGG